MTSKATLFIHACLPRPLPFMSPAPRRLRTPIARLLHLVSECDTRTAEEITFLWVFTYPLSVYPPLLLPSILAFIVTTVETIGDVTTTAEVSKLPTEGAEHFEVLSSEAQRVAHGPCTILDDPRCHLGGLTRPSGPSAFGRHPILF